VRLQWQDFRLDCDSDGQLVFEWPKFCRIASHARLCASVRLVPQGAGGAGQWIFQLRSPERRTPGLVVVRVDVPPDLLREAEEYTELLRRHFGIPDHQDEAAEDAELGRVPVESREWIVAPAGEASEELFRDVMARVAGDSG
jgi:hypothetical protein